MCLCVAPAASDKEMGKEDADLIERQSSRSLMRLFGLTKSTSAVTLNTLFAFDQLRFLLRQRSITLNLFSLRAQCASPHAECHVVSAHFGSDRWEEHRAKILSDEKGLRSDLSAFITKARWTTRMSLTFPHHTHAQLMYDRSCRHCHAPQTHALLQIQSSHKLAPSARRQHQFGSHGASHALRHFVA